MATDLFGKGNDEFINENYQQAVELYSQAIELERNRDDIFANRAQAYLKLEKYKEAAEDASEALSLNPTNQKACLRKGMALFYLEDYMSAKDVFTQGLALDGNDSSLKPWIRKCEAELDLAEQNKTAQSTVGISETKVEEPLQNGLVGEKTTSASAPAQVQPADQAKPSIPMPSKEKSRYDWYQTSTHVVVTVMLKNVKEEDVSIDIQEKSLSATIKLPSGSDYSLELDLSHPVATSQSTYKIYKTKIEIKLKKKEGIHWHNLEGDETHVKQIEKEEHDHAVQYPSSSHYTRNWDKLAKDAEKEEENDKKEGDAALNDLFQKIYADGSDETKKAMLKSFYESGGTVLSTNWKEIGAQKTEVKPPDGMEFRKWDQ